HCQLLKPLHKCLNCSSRRFKYSIDRPFDSIEESGEPRRQPAKKAAAVGLGVRTLALIARLRFGIASFSSDLCVAFAYMACCFGVARIAFALDLLPIIALDAAALGLRACDERCLLLRPLRTLLLNVPLYACPRLSLLLSIACNLVIHLLLFIDVFGLG